MCNLSEAIEEKAIKKAWKEAEAVYAARYDDAVNAINAERMKAEKAEEALRAKDEEIRELKALVASLQR